MKIKEYRCCCGNNEFYLANGNPAGIYCCSCGKWLKWASKDDINLFKHEEEISQIMYYKDGIENFISELFDEITKHADNDESYTLMIHKDTCKEIAKDWDKVKWFEAY